MPINTTVIRTQLNNAANQINNLLQSPSMKKLNSIFNVKSITLTDPTGTYTVKPITGTAPIPSRNLQEAKSLLKGAEAMTNTGKYITKNPVTREELRNMLLGAEKIKDPKTFDAALQHFNKSNAERVWGKFDSEYIDWFKNYYPGSFKLGGDIPTLKSGNKIHIKKKNRGKFTDYCGGKVTEECIRRGKNSSNPTIRKRATFAANARKWNKK